MLKEDLYKIVQHHYALPAGLSEYEAVQQIIGVLGSTDPELRDQLGYTILSKWLVDKNLLTTEQLEEILDEAISENMLFHRIGEAGTDSIFLRSFSSLLIALILIRDNRDNFLSEASFRHVMDNILAYCQLEKDYRSFVPEKGWAHAPAHISDVIDECVHNRFTSKDDCKMMWNALLVLLENAPYVFDAEEDERIATAVTSMVVSNKVSIETLIDWLEELVVPIGKDLLSMYRQINMKHFIRSLSSRLHAKKLVIDESSRLIAVEHRFNPFV